MTENNADTERRIYRKKLLEELKEIAGNIPEPQSEWDLIWVLSGPQVTFNENPESHNETRERLITGFSLVRQVTAVRLGKSPEELTLKEISENGPRIYFNGTGDMNDALKETVASGLLEGEYNLPRVNLLIGPNEGITRTQEQFANFPRDLAEGSRKVVLVSSAYHPLRVKRYASMGDNPIPLQKLIYYPSLPIKFPLATTAHEIRDKIPNYVEKGYFPKFPKKS